MTVPCSEAQDSAWVRMRAFAGGAQGDNFGVSVATDGSLAVVGAYTADGYDYGDGAAYLYSRTTNWVFVKKLFAYDGAYRDLFGSSVAVSGDVVAVGSPRDDDLGDDTGAVFVFMKDQDGAGNWGVVRKLVGPSSNDWFGDRSRFPGISS